MAKKRRFDCRSHEAITAGTPDAAMRDIAGMRVYNRDSYVCAKSTTQTVEVSVLNQASIMGTVQNGLYDANEPGIDGLLVELLDEFVGADGSDVASFYKGQLFKQKGNKSAGPAKVDAQFMAVALATYFTSSDLAGTVATGYGFIVTQTGIGTKVVNIGSAGAAFDVADGLHHPNQRPGGPG